MLMAGHIEGKAALSGRLLATTPPPEWSRCLPAEGGKYKVVVLLWPLSTEYHTGI